MLQRGDDTVDEIDRQRAAGLLDIDRAIHEIAIHIGRHLLGNGDVFDIFPDLLRAVLVGFIGLLFGLAEAFADFVGRHAHDDLTLLDEGIDGFFAFRGFFEVFQQVGVQGGEGLRADPGEDLPLLRLTSYAVGEANTRQRRARRGVRRTSTLVR